MAQVGVYSPGLLALARRLIDIAKVRPGAVGKKWDSDFFSEGIGPILAP